MGHAPEPVGIVGAGAVARALGRELHAAGVPVVALASRTPASARRAAASIDAGVRVVPCADIPHLAQRAIIAVADAGIASVAASLAAAGMRGIALHTSQFRGVAFGVAGDAPAVAWAVLMAERLGGSVLRLSEEDLPAYHAGAVLASSALAAAIDAATVLMAQAGVARADALQAIGPLCRASVDNVLRLGPAAALTGPIARGDCGTVAAHLAAIRRAPAGAADLYRAAARHLLSLAHERQLPPATLQSLARILDSRDGGGA